ncbi:MAG: nuclear transport factor 2 family protein [Deltaproteobacteria bacterium]|nr:nuclear transport factor 2 family protein [Deltaproteobacteria bacterium]
MEASKALKRLYFGICEALSSGDAAFFAHHFSQEDGVLAIGTDPEEWWAGYGAITKVFKSQLEEAGGFQIRTDTPQAYREGAVGWVAGRPVLKTADGSEIPFRLTIVLQQEPDDWKIVQWHFSAGVSNEALIGRTLTIG